MNIALQKAPTPATRAHVALVFPTVTATSNQGVPPTGPGVQDPAVPAADAFKGEEIDFVLFPEGYISHSDDLRIASLSKLASELNAPLLVGAEKADDTGRIWQTLIRFGPHQTPKLLYTKHSTAVAVAFELADWEPDVNLPTFEIGKLRVGATICHDHYLGLLPRHLLACGAHVWVNPSYDNVKDIKWSSILRLRAVENRVFSLCTLHHDVHKKTSTHPFGFAPDGRELHARQAGRNDPRPLSACSKPDAIYIVDLDLQQTALPLDWQYLPESVHPRRPRGGSPQLQRLVRLAAPHGKPSIYSLDGWKHVNVSTRVETEEGLLYVGLVADDDLLDPSACFRVIDEAATNHATPVIWNHWNRLPSRPAQIAPLMMGRAIECCAPIVLSDRSGIREMVELSNRNKIPARRAIHQNGEVTANLRFAWGLHSAFKIVTKHLSRHQKARALDRYRTLA
ncbi:MAG: carbon-nitrogen hydrolase family protein [Gammaproteobacteria bacterium]|nr:carbon-nitrogen hydrolase family protein [Gammaproteobacteria bacterium]MYE53439.1 carbon-nitrogen hydrolase family protein [Gammaproteobacteria bacterium]MYF49894.1 carbon-nitrogen hydrolase family protein [Gammaproteobacteria bacterium]